MHDLTTGENYVFKSKYVEPFNQRALITASLKDRELRGLGHKTFVDKRIIPEEFKAKLKAESEGRNMI